MRARDQGDGWRASQARVDQSGPAAPAANARRHRRPATALQVWREGLFTGTLGATAVSFWFLLLDVAGGDPLFTPRSLGAFLAGARGEPIGMGEEVLLVLGYTVLHYAAFIAVALGAVVFIRIAEREPALLVLFILVFEVLEIGFYGMVSILHEVRLLEGLEWQRVAVGNLIASVLMGRHLWYAHPSLRFGLAQAVSH